MGTGSERWKVGNPSKSVIRSVPVPFCRRENLYLTPFHTEFRIHIRISLLPSPLIGLDAVGVHVG